MSESEPTETITVANVSEGPGGDGTAPGVDVSLPTVELLTGRGFVTGKSGSGKSNSASVIAEKLLDAGFGLFIVDVEGEYYGLKEEFELLHAGADEECDVQVDPEHAEKLASLALERNVPIILDVSGYLDEEVANDLVFETARHLFAKEKKLKQPFLLLVEEVHEYIPEGGGLDEAGKMLVKIGKRGRKHGLGIVGISQRPANVKKDFITQCDWLVWHRLTWDNDTKVVRRIIDREHADAVEDLDDGEAFLMTDWSESVRRVQFHRKRTFDAGATPGLDDFERPELKSVSGDLVEDLREISETQERRESELADLRTELEAKEARIRKLEAELERARDLEQMADRFSQALLDRAEAPYRGGGDGPERTADATDESAADGAADESAADRLDERPPLSETDPWPDPTAAAGEGEREDESDEGGRETAPSDPATGAGAGRSPPDARGDDGGGPGSDGEDEGTDADVVTDGTVSSDPPEVTFAPTGESAEPSDLGTRHGTRTALVEDLIERIAALEPVTRGMLRHYRAAGPATPVDAHLVAGGDADREMAYSRTRTLRRAGLVTHAGRGEYDYALPNLVREEGGDRLRPADLDEAVRAVEASFVEREADGGDAEEPIDESEADAVEVVTGSGEGSPAFRAEDAEFVDEGELVGADAAAERDRDAGGGAADGATDEDGDGNKNGNGPTEEAVVMEETTDPSDGLVDRSEEPRDAEFVD